VAELAAVRDGLKARLATISGLRAHDVWPDTVNAPAALVRPIRDPIQETLSNQQSWRFEVVLVAAPAQAGMARGQDTLDPYLAAAGTLSINAALRGDRTLGGIVSTLNVEGWRDYGVLDLGIGIEYVGAIFDVQVWQ
jgi:hypothetical protein